MVYNDKHVTNGPVITMYDVGECEMIIAHGMKIWLTGGHSFRHSDRSDLP
jgi:hypothetical protein